MIKNAILLCVILAAIGGCTPYKKYYNTLGHYKIGNRYTIKGIQYYPMPCDSYSEVGTASWYGIEDHNTPTANCEIFDRHKISAAHKTLPLPSFVLVTNLKNGKKLVIRVNDRGPFIGNRIIDLSEKAAELLGFHEEGLATVHVKYLKNMSERLIKNSTRYKWQHKKAMKAYYKQREDAKVKRYVASFNSIDHAKATASKLRKHGTKHVKIVHKNEQYYVKVK